jgi:hypothetical protein
MQQLKLPVQVNMAKEFGWLHEVRKLPSGAKRQQMKLWAFRPGHYNY